MNFTHHKDVFHPRSLHSHPFSGLNGYGGSSFLLLKMSDADIFIYHVTAIAVIFLIGENYSVCDQYTYCTAVKVMGIFAVSIVLSGEINGSVWYGYLLSSINKYVMKLV